MAKRKTVQVAASGQESGTLPATELNDNQKKFCRYFAKCGNATVAYSTVYKNAEYDSCRNNAARLLANDSVKQYLKILRERDAAALDITREKIIRAIARNAFNDRRKDQSVFIESLWTKLGFDSEPDTESGPVESEAILDSLQRAESEE